MFNDSKSFFIIIKINNITIEILTRNKADVLFFNILKYVLINIILIINKTDLNINIYYKKGRLNKKKFFIIVDNLLFKKSKFVIFNNDFLQIYIIKKLYNYKNVVYFSKNKTYKIIIK